MAAHRVAELTRAPSAERVLADLNRNNYSRWKLAQPQGAPAIYEFHPLFREFLLRRAQDMLPAVALLELRERAAALLEADGETAEAVPCCSRLRPGKTLCASSAPMPRKCCSRGAGACWRRAACAARRAT